MEPTIMDAPPGFDRVSLLNDSCPKITHDKNGQTTRSEFDTAKDKEMQDANIKIEYFSEHLPSSMQPQKALSNGISIQTTEKQNKNVQRVDEKSGDLQQQSSEIEVLQAIFHEDFKVIVSDSMLRRHDKRKAKEQVDSPLNMFLFLIIFMIQLELLKLI